MDSREEEAVGSAAGGRLVGGMTERRTRLVVEAGPIAMMPLGRRWYPAGGTFGGGAMGGGGCAGRAIGGDCVGSSGLVGGAGCGAR